MLTYSKDLKERNYGPAKLAYERLVMGIEVLSPVTVLHFTIDLYNCSVEIFQADDIKMTIEWASKALDCAGVKKFEDNLSKKHDTVVLNSSRLLGEFFLDLVDYPNSSSSCSMP